MSNLQLDLFQETLKIGLLCFLIFFSYYIFAIIHSKKSNKQKIIHLSNDDWIGIILNVTAVYGMAFLIFHFYKNPERYANTPQELWISVVIGTIAVIKHNLKGIFNLFKRFFAE